MKYTFEFLYHLTITVKVTIEADNAKQVIGILTDLIGRAKANKAHLIDVR